jgi:Transposase
MPYRIAGIDVHKKMLAVAVADVEVDGDFHFERQKVGTTPIDLRRLADWLVEHEVEEVVMESTAQYWRPVWEALEQQWLPRRRARNGAPRLAGTLHLAQAQSNRGPGGRKKDFPDAERWTAKPIRPSWRHSRPRACVPRPSSCATPSRRVRHCIRCTVGC